MTVVESDRTDRLELASRIRELAESILMDDSLFVVDIVVRGRQRATSVVVYVDGDDGITINQCATISRSLDALLLLEEVVESDTRLEVSSPGLSRPLVMLRQYRRHIGRDLRVEMDTEDENGRFLEGKLVSVGKKSITVETGSGTCDVQYDSIRTALVKLPW